MILCEKGTQRELSLEEVGKILDSDAIWEGISFEYRISTVDLYFIYKEGNTYRVKVNCHGNEAFVKNLPTLEFACEVLGKLADNFRYIGSIFPVKK